MYNPFFAFFFSTSVFTYAVLAVKTIVGEKKNARTSAVFLKLGVYAKKKKTLK